MEEGGARYQLSGWVSGTGLGLREAIPNVDRWVPGRAPCDEQKPFRGRGNTQRPQSDLRKVVKIGVLKEGWWNSLERRPMAGAGIGIPGRGKGTSKVAPEGGARTLP